MQVECLGKRRATDVDQVKIEKKTYDVLASRESTAAGIARSVSPGPWERNDATGVGVVWQGGRGKRVKLFKPDLRAKAAGTRRRLLAEVVEKVENRARGGEVRLQRRCGRRWRVRRTAQESMLEYVDRFKGAAYIRCMSFNEKARDWKKDGVEGEAVGKVGCEKLGG